jgi:hypothetical protein
MFQYVNETEKFWKHSYRVHLSELDPDGILINADNEQDALDSAIDYAESQGWEGLFLDDADIHELENDGYLEEHISGGNHGRYLSSLNVTITQLD